MINVFEPALKGEEAERVAQVFATNWIGHGKLVDAFCFFAF